MIDMPQTRWGGAMQQMVQNSPLVAAYTVIPNGQGSQLAVQLKRPANVQWAEFLGPTGNKNPRIVLDIVPM